MLRNRKSRKSRLAASWAALLLAFPVIGGEKVQIRGSTTLELPKPIQSLEEIRGPRRGDSPSGRSEYEGGIPPSGPSSNANPDAEKKLKEAIDKKKNWIFMNPYEAQYDRKTAEFLQGEKSTGLYNHRLMKDDEKGVVERFVQEKTAKRDNESESGPNRKEVESDTPGKREGLGFKEESNSLQDEGTSPMRQERSLSLDSTLEQRTSFVGDGSAFQKRLERSPFSDNIFGERGPDRNGLSSNRDFRKDREVREAEFNKIIQPRSMAVGSDPLNSSLDLTRQEANPIGARRMDPLSNIGRAESSVTAAASRNAPVFAGPSIGGSPDQRVDFSDLGSKVSRPSAFGPTVSLPTPAAQKPSFNAAPFVLPRPQRKF